MKKRIFALTFCLAMIFTAMAYMGIDNPVVPTASAATVQVSGNVNSQTINENTVWVLNGNVTLNGTITIKDGVKFLIKNSDTSATRTITRASGFTGDMFHVDEGGSFQVNGAQWNNGSWDSQNPTVGPVVLDGNSSVQASGNIIDNRGKLAVRDTVIRNNNGAPAIYLGGSGRGERYDTAHNRVVTVEITRSLIENSKATTAGGIDIADSTPADYTIDLWYSEIRNCSAIDASAIYFHGGGQAEVTMRNSVVDNCDTTTGGEGYYGGALRTNGNGRYKFTMQDSVLRNCDSWKFGGGIYWNASGTGSQLTVTDCQFLNNTAAEMGGGMFLEGSDMTITASTGSASAPVTNGLPGNLTGTLIQGNRAPNGGGISYKCYSNSAEVQVPTTVANFNQNVIFKDNTGKNGAALAYNLHDTHNYPTGATFTFNINGAQFTNNVGTGNGGAIYVRKCRTDYVCTVNFNSGTITDNDAKNGGAIAIVTDPGVTVGGTVNMAGGTLSNNTATANGGALYVQKGNFNLNGGTVASNSAVNGGAACVTDGNFTMNGGTMDDNTAATNGGAAYVTGGNFKMTNGNMTANTAADKGGAAYVTGGNFEMTGGTMGGSADDANTAEDGGAIFVNTGKVTMKGGTISYNSADNGGGAYVNGGDFEMISGSLLNNTAVEYGGGAFSAGGNITIGVKDCAGTGQKHSVTYTNLTHPVVKDNTAVFGGGLAVDGGKVDIHCCEITNNTSDNNGTGMNIFMFDSDTSDGKTGIINHLGGTVGEETNHGMVAIGGQLNVPYEEGMIKIQINYHDNGEDLVFEVWVSEAPEEYYLNLPYCPQLWETTQNEKGLTFVGWTHDTVTTEPPVGEVVDLSFIRDKDDYKALGDPAKIKRVEWKKDEQGGYYIDFYAVWAPKVNEINYSFEKDCLAPHEDLKDNMTVGSQYPAAYNYTLEKGSITIPEPEYAGYDFLGWRLEASPSVISNWNSDVKEGNVTDECSLYSVATGSGTDRAGNKWSYDANGNLTIETNQNFGFINMVALFEAQYGDLTITKELAAGVDPALDPDQVFIFNVSGDPANEDLGHVDMDVTINGAGSANIDRLPVGNYTVTEVQDWSWRYTPDKGSKTAEVTKSQNAQVGFSNSRTIPYWLSGDAYCENMFLKVTNN